MNKLAKITIILVCFMSVILAFTLQKDFLTDQKRYERVRTAINEKEQIIEKNLKSNNLDINNLNILLVAYKDSDQMNLFAKKKEENIYRKIHTYKICSRSGKLGPKRKEGDSQVPEGFYYIDRFNPASNFYLSLGINYPNQSDRRKSNFSNLGGDIFIHGACVTIGCLPMTNDKIKEIYLYAVYAKNNGQAKIPVYIFPFKMTNQNMSAYKSKYKNNKELLDFWSNLKSGYDKFFSEMKELTFRFAENGDYIFF